MRPTWQALILAGCLAVAIGAAAEEAQAERVAVGQEAPPFTLTASDGETYSLGTLRGEKNVVLIFFRGTW